MKKLLSLILVAVMIVTTIPIVFAEGETYKVGDIIQFGSYPQSDVKDKTLIAELNALAPAWDNWTSYDYYNGSGSYGTMKQGDWMRYVDIKHDGNLYRGIKISSYRPYNTLYDSSSSNEYQYENGYGPNVVHWFKFENIDWRVLDPSTGLVMCETIIDSQPYSTTIYFNSSASSRYAYFSDSSYENYASDYETSSIRQWLNNDFYNTAFTDSEKKEISTTTLNNDGYYTLTGTTGYEKLDSNETKDKIFLLSYNEARNSNFGFNSDPWVDDTARLAKGSDYARCQGLYVAGNSNGNSNGNYNWLLRSSGNNSRYCCYVSSSGYSSNGYCQVYFTCYGIRPALRLCKHNHIPTITPPTCITQGFTTYICECGDTYVDDYVEATGHSFINYISDGTATCITDGKLIAKCDNCNATDTKSEKGTHKFSEDFTVDVEATCTKEGEKSRHCIYCSEVTDLTTIDKLDHAYNISFIESTCTDRGLKIYICSCGDSYTETLPATGHTFNGSVCTDCGYDKADTCSCNCHKSGLSALLWKLLNFFYKLLRINETCACGTVHY